MPRHFDTIPVQYLNIFCFAYRLNFTTFPRSIRREILKDRFNFKCHCAACSNEEEYRMFDQLPKPSSIPSPFDVVGMGYPLILKHDDERTPILFEIIKKYLNNFDHVLSQQTCNARYILEICFELLTKSLPITCRYKVVD